MRLALRNTLVWLAVYTVAMVVFGAWLHRQLQDSLSSALDDSARLVADQLSAVLQEPIESALRSARPERDAELQSVLATARERSALIVSLTVVGAEGQVLATDNAELAKLRYGPPHEVFADDSRTKLLGAVDESEPTEGSRIVAVPLSMDGQLVGYVRARLQRRALSQLYDDYYFSLLVAAVAGLLAIVGFGIVMQVQLNRTVRRLSSVIEDFADGRLTVLPDEPGEFAGITRATARLAERIRDASEGTSQARTELKTLAAALQAGVVLVDGEGRIEFANTLVHRLLGADDSDAAELATEVLQRELQPALEQLRARPGETVRCDLSLEVNGAVRQMHCETFPVDGRGAVVLLRSRELMDHVELDLRASSHLRAITKLYEGAVHDLRAPMNAIVLNLDMLDQLVRNKVDDDEVRQRADRYARTAREQIARLNRFLSDLLERSVAINEESGVVDLNRLVSDVADLVETQASREQVSVDLRLDGGSVAVDGFPDALHQVVLNLAMNGIEAMSDGGTLTLGTHRDPQWSEIEVEDTGPGIPSSLLHRIFDMHFTTKATGTGIGLFVARSVIERHGGEILVESTLGQGSKFTIRLPSAALRPAEPLQAEA